MCKIPFDFLRSCRNETPDVESSVMGLSRWTARVCERRAVKSSIIRPKQRPEIAPRDRFVGSECCWDLFLRFNKSLAGSQMTQGARCLWQRVCIRSIVWLEHWPVYCRCTNSQVCLCVQSMSDLCWPHSSWPTNINTGRARKPVARQQRLHLCPNPALL